MRISVILIVFTLATPLYASPPEVLGNLTAKSGKPVLFDVKVESGKKLGWAPGYEKLKCPVVRLYSEDPTIFSFMAIPDEVGTFTLTFWTAGETAYSQAVITVSGPVLPPIPPPVPPPLPPLPVPVTSFRVILIFESGDNLTIAQRSVVYGKGVEDWLNTNCTGGKNGWRRRDKDSPGEADVTMAAMWAAIKPTLTVVPCIAIEVNGKIEIINLKATPVEMIAVLNTYRGK